MTAVRVRLLGGVLNGQVVWVEENCAWVDVHVAAGAGIRKTFRYLREGEIARFETTPEAPTVPPA